MPSVGDGKGTLRRLLQTEREELQQPIHSLRERQIPTVGIGTLASVTDGKGTLCRRYVTGKVPSSADGMGGASLRL